MLADGARHDGTLAGGGGLVYAYVQMSNRVTLNVDAEDIPGSLLLADMVALGIVLAVSLLLYLPDCCRFEGAEAGKLCAGKET